MDAEMRLAAACIEVLLSVSERNLHEIRRGSSEEDTRYLVQVSRTSIKHLADRLDAAHPGLLARAREILNKEPGHAR